MRLSEKNSNRIALICTALIHISLLYISFPGLFQINAQIEPVNYRIPIQMEVIKPKPKIKKRPKKIIKPAKPNKFKAVKKNQPKPISKLTGDNSKTIIEPNKPVPSNSLPGDQDKPELTGEAKPIYPKAALNQELSGTVIISVTISKQGLPRELAVVQSTGYKILDEAFMKAIQEKYTFKPVIKLGEPQESKIELSYTFSLDM